MRNRLGSWILAVAIVFAMCPASLAAERVTPTPPEWIKAEEYVVFEDGKVYQTDYWDCVLQLRADALAGNPRPGQNSALWSAFSKLESLTYKPSIDPAAVYEMSLIDLMYHKNRRYSPWNLDNEILYSILREQEDTLDEATRTRLELWSARWIFQTEYYGRTEKQATVKELPGRIPDFVEQLEEIMKRCGMTTIDEFLDCGTMKVEQGQKTYQWMSVAGRADGRIAILVDGKELKMDVAPEVKNQRTMVPIRAVAEALGARVEWEQESQRILMTRAGTTVTMTLDSAVAVVDEKEIEMDVAPYATEGRTLIPARYVAEFFGQRVEWNGKKQQVLIEEDKTAVGESNLEAWALPMGAILSKINGGDPDRFGLYQRNASEVTICKNILDGGSWNIPDRESLAYTVFSMTMYGHDSTFREMAEDVKLRTEEERKEISKASNAWPFYMWEYTEYVDEKWGDRGIMAWDLFRMSNLVQWGYTAGYITYAEALELLQPAAMLLCESFSSWDEAYENYLDGYNWWARNDVLGKDAWETERGRIYREMREDTDLRIIFDDSLFETGVIGLPENNVENQM